MNYLDQLIETVDEGEILDVRIGLHWTAVIVNVNGEKRCGLASTLIDNDGHCCGGGATVPAAGHLQEMSSVELLELTKSETSVLRSVGISALNALLPRYPDTWTDINAEDVILEHGKGQEVALVGSFPFIPRIKDKVGKLFVFDQNPGEDEYSPSDAPNIIPRASVVAITGMTMVNQTFEGLLNLCSPEATVLVLGPSTPLSPVMYDYGVNLLSGSIVENIDAVVTSLSQSATFRQVHKAGVRLVTMDKA